MRHGFLTRTKFGSAAAALATSVSLAALVTSPVQAYSPLADHDCNEFERDETFFVECTLDGSGKVDIEAMMADYWRWGPPELDSTPVTIAARGGRGDGGSSVGYNPADGGLARTVRTYGELQAMDLHAYVGQDGVKRAGGSASLVTTVPLDTLDPDALDLRDVLVIGGGGGASGRAYMNALCDYGNGKGGKGGGGDAIASNVPLAGAGGNGGAGWELNLVCEHNGKPGKGGGDGLAGVNSSRSGYEGTDGIGGLGGGYNDWAGGLASAWPDGEGGSPENSVGTNAAGGGGWGGGAAAYNGSGAGGGGGFAAAATTHPVNSSLSAPGFATVSLIWPIESAMTQIPLEIEGDGVIEVYIDGDYHRSFREGPVRVPATTVLLTFVRSAIADQGVTLYAKGDEGKMFDEWFGAVSGKLHVMMPVPETMEPLGVSFINSGYSSFSYRIGTGASSLLDESLVVTEEPVFGFDTEGALNLVAPFAVESEAGDRLVVETLEFFSGPAFEDLKASGYLEQADGRVTPLTKFDVTLFTPNRAFVNEVFLFEIGDTHGHVATLRFNPTGWV